MPRPGPRRPMVAVRLSEATVERLDEIAERDGTTRSDVIRVAVEREIKRQARSSG